MCAVVSSNQWIITSLEYLSFYQADIVTELVVFFNSELSLVNQYHCRFSYFHSLHWTYGIDMASLASLGLPPLFLVRARVSEVAVGIRQHSCSAKSVKENKF